MNITYELDINEATTLNEAKNIKYKLIDKRTGELISAGFTYNGVVYSMSENAQNNLIGAFISKDGLTYPIYWNSKDDSSLLTINDSTELVNFYSSALTHKRTQQDNGTTLKNSVRDATTIDEVKAIIDNR